MAYCKSLINDQWSLIMQFSKMSFISMYSHVYSGIHVALLLKSVFLFICIFNSICSDLSSISSYSRLYSGMVALRKFASHANSKHLQQLQYWKDSRNWNIWCILMQKFQVNFSCVWSIFWCTLIIIILNYYLILLSLYVYGVLFDGAEEVGALLVQVFQRGNNVSRAGKSLQRKKKLDHWLF